MSRSDADRGMLILVAQHHYKTASFVTLAAVWLFGHHEIVRHLGRVGRVGFWKGTPYLLTFREVA